ncbi:alkaline shock response membrane anchor protein AmaP [Arthrobacter sp. H16F315]|uniref:alkaline shock response membrane anchor protein AmaP n=1 Tax=Arthrobacter sp. H16F315 TaxID=2955314 RepID=UPI002096C3AE|nr:alkaline shock response membrane anchor protein AmaP [Arthrobacter sp. H16F315]MDD1477570.1 alkaline shock response membrane anchor protein AmaP [Arthrobacter sp. H16F315]
MPWWSWIVIWIALVALSLLLFVALGVRLFRTFMATVKELGEAAERFASFPSAGPASENNSENTRSDGAGDAAGKDRSVLAGEPGSAVFASPAQLRHDYRAAKTARQEARRRRRVRRKMDRGQPQRLSDIEFTKT